MSYCHCCYCYTNLPQVNNFCICNVLIKMLKITWISLFFSFSCAVITFFHIVPFHSLHVGRWMMEYEFAFQCLYVYMCLCLMNADFKYDGYWILLFCFIISAKCAMCIRLSHILFYTIYIYVLFQKRFHILITRIQRVHT